MHICTDTHTHRHTKRERMNNEAGEHANDVYSLPLAAV